MDKPNYRKVHKSPIPTLGGTPVFISFWIITFCLSELTGIAFIQIIPLFIATLIIFITGIYDDLSRVTIPRKLILEGISLMIVMLFYDLNPDLLNLHIDHRHFESLITMFINVIIGLTIINAINFTDGIDTLASRIIISIMLPLTIWFYSINQMHYSILSAAVIGSLFAFAKFNSSPAKIFLGDTGSLVLGFLVSFLIFKFWCLNQTTISSQAFNSPESAIMGLLLVPLTDFISVIYERLKAGKSILRPDINHLHHKLLNKLGSHQKAAQLLMLINAISAAFVIIFRDYPAFFQLIALIIYALVTRILIFRQQEKEYPELNFIDQNLI